MKSKTIINWDEEKALQTLRIKKEELADVQWQRFGEPNKWLSFNFKGISWTCIRRIAVRHNIDDYHRVVFHEIAHILMGDAYKYTLQKDRDDIRRIELIAEDITSYCLVHFKLNRSSSAQYKYDCRTPTYKPDIEMITSIGEQIIKAGSN